MIDISPHDDIHFVVYKHSHFVSFSCFQSIGYMIRSFCWGYCVSLQACLSTFKATQSFVACENSLVPIKYHGVACLSTCLLHITLEKCWNGLGFVSPVTFLSPRWRL